MKDRNNEEDEIEYVATEIIESSDLFSEEDLGNVGADEQEWYEGDLQLAAELGKTLLERNRELESNLKQQQVVIEDQTLEIEYLSKQTAALKEVNESRVRVYEQLEVSLQDLEKTHQKLQNESDADKKKIKSLNNSLDVLEKQCEDLQQAVDELRSASRKQERQSKRRERRRTLGLGMEFDAAELRRVLSVENGIGPSSDLLEREAENLRLQQTVREMKTQRGREQKLRDELELEIACLLQENEQFREQLTALQQRETVMKALQLELQEMEDEEQNSPRLCRQCRRPSDYAEDGNNNNKPSMLDNDVDDDVEEDPSLDAIESNQLTIVRLENGVLAYGSSQDAPPATEDLALDHTSASNVADVTQTSLLSELDTQYRLLIEKYEAMINARQMYETGRRTQATPSPRGRNGDVEPSSQTSNYTQFEGESGQMMDNGGEESGSLSSGFSDSSDVTQTVSHKEVQTDMTSTTRATSRNSILLSNPLENHFSRTPEYKQLFQEIFAVLKKSVQTVETVTSAHAAAAAVAIKSTTTSTSSSSVVDVQEMDITDQPSTAIPITNAKRSDTSAVKTKDEKADINTTLNSGDTRAFPALRTRECPTQRLPTSPDRTYADVVVTGRQSRNWKPK